MPVSSARGLILVLDQETAYNNKNVKQPAEGPLANNPDWAKFPELEEAPLILHRAIGSHRVHRWKLAVPLPLIPGGSVRSQAEGLLHCGTAL